MKKVAVVMPVKNEERIQDLLEKIFSSIPNYDTSVVLVVDDNSIPAFRKGLATIAGENPRVHVLYIGALKPLTFAYTYLQGLEYAVKELEADFVVEMDGNGSHKPEDLPAFIAGLENGAGAVLSTRFCQGGKVVEYPPQRRLISVGGTVLANLVLGLGQLVSDMTSGYEAFDGRILQRLFKLVPTNRWISANEGPGHFYQTEMRTYLCWMGCKISIVPIIWGAGRVEKPTKLPFGDLTKSLKGLWRLRKRRREFKTRSQT